MRKSNFALRLQARKLSESEGVALNQLINVAVAEKLSALRTESYLGERAARGNVKWRCASSIGPASAIRRTAGTK